MRRKMAVMENNGSTENVNTFGIKRIDKLMITKIL